MGAEASARLLAEPFAELGSGSGVATAASTSLKSDSSGAKILASTSLSSVMCLTSSLGRAVMASAKCVVAGKMSMG
jgi:hypothetical protein